MRPHPASWLRSAVAAAVLGVLVLRFGADPVVRGVRDADVRLVVLALGLTGLATACCAWRWQAMSAGLGIELGFREAFAACYRAQLLNATLPAGLLGDVHRAAQHARRSRSAVHAVRSVAEERVLGLLVQAALTGAVVAVLPSPLRPLGLVGAVGLAVLTVGAVLVSRGARRLPGVRVLLDDVARLRSRPGTTPVVLATSLGVVACHATVLSAAMATTGVDASWQTRVALALTVLIGSALPIGVAGWGPREGVAAWAYAAVGLPASDGLAASVTYGVVALVATLPGVVAPTWQRPRPAPRREEAPIG